MENETNLNEDLNNGSGIKQSELLRVLSENWKRIIHNEFLLKTVRKIFLVISITLLVIFFFSTLGYITLTNLGFTTLARVGVAFAIYHLY